MLVGRERRCLERIIRWRIQDLTIRRANEMFAIEVSQNAKRKLRDCVVDRFESEILPTFAEWQRVSVNMFLPFVGLSFPILEDGLYDEEYHILKEDFRELGFEIEFYTTSAHRTSLKVVCINSSSMKKGRCLTPSELARAADAQAFSWLSKKIRLHLQNANSVETLSKFTLVLPTFVHPSPETGMDNNYKICRYRETLFDPCVAWFNLLSCYEVGFNESRFYLKYKEPSQIAKANKWSGAILFSALHCLDRVKDESEVNWTKLPKEVIRLILIFVLGPKARAFGEDPNKDKELNESLTPGPKRMRSEPRLARRMHSEPRLAKRIRSEPRLAKPGGHLSRMAPSSDEAEYESN